MKEPATVAPRRSETLRAGAGGGRIRALVVAWCLTSVLVGLAAARHTLRLERENQQLRGDIASYRRAAASADERLWNCHGLVDNLTRAEPDEPRRRAARPSRRALTVAAAKRAPAATE
jgi:hypothetical protein